jgi:transcriptional regulator with XRE-family HTH domain
MRNSTPPSYAGTMLLRDAIGTTLRRLRLEQGKTLRQLARESLVSLPYLSEIERGRKEASSEILATLSRALDVPLDSVMHEVSERLAVYELVELPTRSTDAVLLAA